MRLTLTVQSVTTIEGKKAFDRVQMVVANEGIECGHATITTPVGTYKEGAKLEFDKNIKGAGKD